MSLWYRILKFLVRPIFKLLFFYKIRKPKTKFPDGGCLVCSNHISAVDPVFLAFGLRRQLWFFAKAEVEKTPVLRRLAKRFAITVNRGSADLKAMRSAIDALSDGKQLCVFPQGTRRRGEIPSETEIKSGAGMMAYRSKCYVIPAYINSKNYKLRVFRRMNITFGEPIKYEEFGFERGDKAEIDAAANLIWQRICELAPDKKEV